MKKLLKRNFDVNDVIKAMIQCHYDQRAAYDDICKPFDQGGSHYIAMILWKFCKENIVYTVEPDTDQTVRTPQRILADGYGDSKHYALFIAGILDALRRTGIEQIINIKYRFVGESKEFDIHHVFIVMENEFGEVHIDPLLKFNERKEWAKCFDLEIKK